MANGGPSHRVVTPDDQSALILIIALFLLVASILAVFGRVAIRYGMTKSVTRDDWAAALATLLGLAQTVAIAVATESGLGKVEHRLSSAHISRVIKALYASDYFYIAAVGCSKVSVLLLLRKLAASKVHKQICFYTVCYVGVWSVASILVVGVRCGAQAPWDFSKNQSCVNQRRIWIGISPFDIISEIVIMVLPILMMAPVQVPLSKKVFVVTAFGSRVLYVAAVIVRLFYPPLDFRSANFTGRDSPAVYATQTVLCLAIVTACIPAMKPLMEAFNSGGMIVRVNGTSSQNHYGMGSHSGSHHSYAMGSMVKSQIRAETTEDESPSSSSRSRKARSPTHQDHTASQFVSRKMSHGSEGDRDSISSQAQSEQMIIKKNVQWTVKYEGGQDYSAPT